MEEQVKGSVFVVLCAVFWGINSVVAQYLFSFHLFPLLKF